VRKITLAANTVANYLYRGRLDKEHFPVKPHFARVHSLWLVGILSTL